jgi:hypothetical protein
VQGGHAWAGGTDVEHGGPGVRLHHPGGPRAALGLHGDEPAQFFLDPGPGAEGQAQAVSRLGELGQGLGDEPLPAAGLRGQVGRRERAGDRHGSFWLVSGALRSCHDGSSRSRTRATLAILATALARAGTTVRSGGKFMSLVVPLRFMRRMVNRVGDRLVQ